MSGFISACGVADALTTTLPNAVRVRTSTAMTLGPQVTSGSAIPMSNVRRTNPAISTYDQTASIELSVRQNTWSGHGGRPDWVSGAGPWSHAGSWPWYRTPTTLLTQTTTVMNILPPPTAEGSQSPSSPPPSTKKGGVNIDVSTAVGIGVGVSIALLLIGVAIASFCWARSNRRKRRKALALENESRNIEESNNDNTLWPPYLNFASNNESPVELPAALSPREMPAENKPQEKDASDDRGGLWLDGRELERRASKASVDIGVVTVPATITV